jgi:hypothetical protein
MKQYRKPIAIIGAVIFAQIAVAAPILYIDDASGVLGKVDVQTGATTVVGSTGQFLTDIAFDPTGHLFGITFTGLFSIDRATAAATFIGSLGIPGANALVFGADGTLYAAGSTTSLYRVNTSTGGASVLGNIGFSSAGDLAFHDGQLYLSSTTNQLIRIDPSTFAGSAVGNLGFSSVFGLANGDDNVLYGVAGTQIFSVNTATGAGTLSTNYAGNGLGQANGTSFFREATVGVRDDASTCGLLALASGIVFVMHRRKNMLA